MRNPKMAAFLASAWSAAWLSGLFLVVYGWTNSYSATLPDVGVIRFDWEMELPFLAWMIAPYMILDLFFVTSPFLCRDAEDRRILELRIAFAILFAGICFLLYPLKCTYVKPDSVEGVLGWIFANFLAVDKPFNQCPSLHVALSGILAPHFGRRLPRWLAPVVYATLLLSAISTIFTYQHHLIDVVGGALLLVLVFLLFPEKDARFALSHPKRIGLNYAVVAGTLAWTALTVRGAGLVLLWPAFSSAVVAAGYFGFGPGIYLKRDGRIPLVAKLLLAPQLLAQWLSLHYYARWSPAYQSLLSTVWIGRKLSEAEARAAISQGVTAVLDLTCEFDATEAFLEAPIRYRNVQILDLTAPSDEQIREAVEFLREESARGIVYVHCKAGYSRTAAIAGAWLLSSTEAASAEQAMGILRKSRTRMVIRPEVEAALRALQER